ncbi:hypothetical protein BDV06DRAFT_7902 [Aspergillus oleicola]
MSLEQQSQLEDSRFGLLPFDLFALEKWDYNAPSSEEESKRQWKHLAWEYQSLTLFQRWPYYKPLVGAVRPAPASKELNERIIGARPLNEDETNFQYNNGMTNEDILEQIEAVPEATLRELARISMQVQAVLYLVDREAITSGLVKVLWLNEHGEAVWDNCIEPGSLEDLTLALQDANSLDEIADGNRNRGDLLLL